MLDMVIALIGLASLASALVFIISVNQEYNKRFPNEPFN